jgi:hypothetical protein
LHQLLLLLHSPLLTSTGHVVAGAGAAGRQQHRHLHPSLQCAVKLLLVLQ